MNTTLLFMGIGTQELLFIALIVLLLFGGKKIPELMKGLGSRSLKSTFLRDIVTKQHSAEFFNKSPKNPHGSFEVICSRSQQYIDYISEDTFIKVASQATF